MDVEYSFYRLLQLFGRCALLSAKVASLLHLCRESMNQYVSGSGGIVVNLGISKKIWNVPETSLKILMSRKVREYYLLETI